MSVTKRLVFLCQTFHPDTTSSSQLFSDLFRRMAEKGWKITVLCGYPTSKTGERPPKLEVWQKIRIRRCGLKIIAKKSLIHRALAYVSFLAGAFWQLLKAPTENTHWFGVTTPPFALHLLALVSMLRKHPFTFMLLDLHPEGMLTLGSFSVRNPVIWIWKKLNRWAYHSAESLAVLGRDMIPMMEKEYGIPASKMVYIPHWSPADVSKPLRFSESKFTEKWRLREKFVVQYSGNMGLWHDMETFVHAAKLLENSSQIQFVFIGSGIRKKSALFLAKNLMVKNIQWHDFVSLENLHESLAACHISLISQQAGLEGIAVPCKLYGILASGRAVIAQVPEKAEVALTVLEHQCGFISKPGNTEDFAQQVRQLANDPELVEKMGQRSFLAYRKYYTVQQAQESFQRFFSA
jgi:glycosyltransferase involved in cell wall biosynthesis